MTRTSQYPIEPLFLDRWSPRAFDASVIPDADLITLFEAARWAPSAFNYQPWRFLYAKRESTDFARFLGLLMPFNQAWVEHASVLIFAVSQRTMKMGAEPAPSHSHSFDTGAAWVQLALQATRLGYQAHGMTGVDFERATTELAVPDDFRVEAGIAVGRQGDPAILPEKLREREFPSERKPLEEIVVAGNFVALQT
ncbi:MAG: nitroreductase family protein [Novosphingobium sp.]